VRLQPNNVDVILSHAVAARALKRYDEARAGYNKVLSLSPNHPGATFNLTVLDQDYSSVDPNDFDQRVRMTQDAIAQFKNVLGNARNEKLKKKAQQRIEEAMVNIEAIQAEKEAAAEEAAAENTPTE